MRDGVLYRRWANCDGNDAKYILFVPKYLQRFILSQLHDSTGGAHTGISKTLSKVKKRFFWYGLRSDVETWCATCDIYGSRKGTHRKDKVFMKQYNVGLPMERIAIDFMDTLVRTTPQNSNALKKYLMVIGDYFTK